MATLTGARAGHTNGWHGPQAGSRLRLGWQALVDCRFRTTWGFGGGCGCKLLGWEVVLFKPKRCGFLCFFLLLVVQSACLCQVSLVIKLDLYNSLNILYICVCIYICIHIYIYMHIQFTLGGLIILGFFFDQV